MGNLFGSIILFIVGLSAIIFFLKSNVFKNGKLWGVVSMVATIVICPVILLIGIIQNVRPTQAGIIVNPMTGQMRPANIGYNLISPWESLNVIESTVSNLKYQTDEAQNDFFGSQTKSSGYVKLISTVSVRVDRDRADKYMMKHGTKSPAQLRDYIKEKLQKSISLVFTKYEASELMKEAGPAATKEAEQILKDDLYNNDYIILENLTISDIEGNVAYEDSIQLNEKIRQETENAKLNQEKVKIEAANAKIVAEGDAAANLARAEGEANAKKAIAKGEAEAIMLMNEALASSNQALEAKKIEAFTEYVKAWDGKMPVITSGESLSLFGFDINEFIKANDKIE